MNDIKHGHAKKKDGVKHTPEYNAWHAMKGRCNLVSNVLYHRYGGRGISYDIRWEDFQNFLDDMGLRPGPEYSIDRMNNDGNYEPDNCRWATKSQQVRNRSTNVWVTICGETYIIKDWCNHLGIKSSSAKWRFTEGKLSHADAFLKPYGLTLNDLEELT